MNFVRDKKFFNLVIDMKENELIISDFNRIAQLDHDQWEHNKHYHKYFLRFVPPDMEKALDIGCGRGEFTRKLAERAQMVIGVDLAPEMIEKAKELSPEYKNITYENIDILQYDLGQQKYDCIVSIATFHHLPLEEMFKKVEKALKAEGIFLLLDLYEQKTIREKLLGAIAVPADIVMMKLKTGKCTKTEQEIKAWKEHAKHDKFMTLNDINRIAGQILPGARVRKHLFWRYSLIWKKLY